jgi:hypothetical protein
VLLSDTVVIREESGKDTIDATPPPVLIVSISEHWVLTTLYTLTVLSSDSDTTLFLKTNQPTAHTWSE